MTAQLTSFLRILWAQRNEKQVQYIDKKIFEVQEARTTGWRAAQVTAVTNGYMGFGMHTGTPVRILRQVQTMEYQLCRVWTGGTEKGP